MKDLIKQKLQEFAVLAADEQLDPVETIEVLGSMWAAILQQRTNAVREQFNAARNAAFTTSGART